MLTDKKDEEFSLYDDYTNYDEVNHDMYIEPQGMGFCVACVFVECYTSLRGPQIVEWTAAKEKLVVILIIDHEESRSRLMIVSQEAKKAQRACPSKKCNHYCESFT